MKSWFAVVIVAGVACQPSRPPLGQMELGPAPEFAVTGLSGETVRFSDLRGKTIVLKFWATWCGPCRKELSEFSQVAEDLGSEDVVFLAPTQETGPHIEGWLKANPSTAPIVIDGTPSSFAAFNIGALPTLVVIDPRGDVVAHTLDKVDLRQVVQQTKGTR